jgi:hypothetical protein
LSALVTLVAQGIVAREEVMAYFQSLLRGKLEREYSYVWDGLVCSCCHIYPGEVMAEIEQAFADDLVEPFAISLESVKRYLEEGEDHVLARLSADPHYSLIEDTIRELEGWACFSESTQPIKTSGSERVWEPAPMRTGPKIGRNEPCPCGSGKKYKKCCGR